MSPAAPDGAESVDDKRWKKHSRVARLPDTLLLAGHLSSQVDRDKSESERPSKKPPDLQDADHCACWCCLSLPNCALPPPAPPKKRKGVSSHPPADPLAADPLAALGSAAPASARAVIGAKQHIRALLSVPGACLSLKELVAASGKTDSNIRTMLSDMRNPRYAGKQGVFLTVSSRGVDGVTRYSQAPAKS